MARRRLLVGLAVVTGVPLVIALVLAARFRPRAEREDPATVHREIVALTAQRDSLRTLVYDAAETSDLLDAQPPGDIVIGMPTPFVESVVRSVVTGWFREVDLRLPRMHVRKSGEVKARLGLFGRRTVGEFDLDVTLDDVRGRLQPGVPDLAFGGNVVRISVPVRVASGTGVAKVKADWHSTGIAGPVCGDLSVTRDVTGQVRARQYMARGRLNLSAVDGTVTADPDFPDLALRIFVDPARSSVVALDSVLESKGGLCGYAIDKSRASERIQAMVERGFRVTIPQRFFRPIRLPLAIETSVPVQERALALEVTPSGLAVTPSAVWFGAAVRSCDATTDGPAPPAGPTVVPAPPRTARCTPARR
jgi:hypothetical protein